MKEKEDINTEQAILEAAEKEFLDKGYALTKTTEIARIAGVNHAMLHYYFRTKENLFNQVFQKKMGILIASFVTKVDEKLPFTEKIKFIVEEHFNFLAENPKLPFFILNEFITNKERLEKFCDMATPQISEFVNKIKMEVNDEIEKGNIAPIDPFNLILDIVSLNVFAFLAHPLVEKITESIGKDYQVFIEQRRVENVLVILRRLKA